MNITNRYPKLADVPPFEFRFITSPTDAMWEEISEMMSRALDYAEECLVCDCPPWVDCGDAHHEESQRWSLRFNKLASANDAALMAIFLAPVWMNKWRAVDTLVLGADGVCRPG